MKPLRIAQFCCWVLVCGCSTTDSRDQSDPLQGGRAEPKPMDEAETGAPAPADPEADCCGLDSSVNCCGRENCVGISVERWCTRGYDSVVSFQRGEGGCFSLGLSHGQSNSMAFLYASSEQLAWCRVSGDGHGAEAYGEYFECSGADRCVVCGRDELLRTTLESSRWCDESDDLPFSLQGIERDRTGVDPNVAAE